MAMRVTNNKMMTKAELVSMIEVLQLKILIYSERDFYQAMLLEAELRELQLQLLNRMTIENNMYLETIKMGA